MCITKVVDEQGLNKLDYNCEFDHFYKNVNLESLIDELMSLISNEDDCHIVDGLYHGIRYIRNLSSRRVKQNGVILNILKNKVNVLISNDIELEERDNLFIQGVVKVYSESINMLSDGKCLL